MTISTTPCPCLSDPSSEDIACGMCWVQMKHDVHCERCEGTEEIPMTTDTENLEAQIAAMTRPCPSCVTRKQEACNSEGDCLVCSGNINLNTGVVPMIEDSRRDCPFTVVDLSEEEAVLNARLASAHARLAQHENADCPCNGLDYVPALSMQKVEEFMLRSGNIVTTLYHGDAMYQVLWLMDEPPDTKYDMFAKSDDLYVAKLTVCLAGLEAMEASK